MPSYEYIDGDEPEICVSFWSCRSSDSNWISDEERLSDVYERRSESEKSSTPNSSNRYLWKLKKRDFFISLLDGNKKMEMKIKLIQKVGCANTNSLS